MINFYLDGNIVISPLEWQDIGVLANFNEFVQPDITIDELTFGFDGLKLIDAWTQTNGYFAGMPLTIKSGLVTVFDGYIDFSQRYTRLHYGKVIVAVKKSKGLNELDDKISGYTMGLLQSKGVTTVNVPYVVEKKENFIELLLVNITTLLLLKELYESIKRLSESVALLTQASTPNAGVPPSVDTGDIIRAVLQVIINVAYTIAIIIALKELIKSIFDKLVSPVRFHKSFKLVDHMTSFANQTGYSGFQSGISGFNNMIYIPSKEEEGKSLGIPNTRDYGYIFTEFFDLMNKTFNARPSVDSANVLHLRSENDPYFVKTATYTMPDVLTEVVEYNTDDLKSSKTISFSTDVKDEWTIEEFTGSAYDINTSNSSSNTLTKGLENISLPVALASRKDGLNDLEKLLKALGGLADTVINALGGNSNFAGKITARVGMMKVSTNAWDKPKLLLMTSNYKLTSNHRSNWNAQVLYDKWHNHKSFVLNNYGYQRRIYKNIEIPFCIEDLQKVLENSYFTTNDNKTGKFTSIKYLVDKNKAVADYWIKETYDTNLIETYVRP